ncbi:MAG TPA: hypothetical protein VH372_11110 [Actinospica sp.]|nr:hypothetical protein [Actinospica sp.]
MRAPTAAYSVNGTSAPPPLAEVGTSGAWLGVLTQAGETLARD